MPNKKLMQVNQSSRKFIIGVDEVGTGSLVGEIYICAFLAAKDWNLDGVKDSKVISEKKRETICQQLENTDSVVFSIAHTHPNADEYKEYGTNLHALLKFLYWKAVREVLDRSKETDILIVLDGIIKFPHYPYSLGESISLPKADALVPQVSAASIIAKNTRDKYIIELGKKYPEYEWNKNKGYSTRQHLATIKKFGICSEHRKSYEPIKSISNEP